MLPADTLGGSEGDGGGAECDESGRSRLLLSAGAVDTVQRYLAACTKSSKCVASRFVACRIVARALLLMLWPAALLHSVLYHSKPATIAHSLSSPTPLPCLLVAPLKTARYLLTLMNGIMDFTKLSTGRLALSMEQFSVEALLRVLPSLICGSCADISVVVSFFLFDKEISDMMSNYMTSTSTVIHFKLDGGLADVVLGDRGRIAQVCGQYRCHWLLRL